jgi:hypothetical protein
MKKPTGYTIFEGKSPITGDDIIAVITLKSTNIKTGNMASMSCHRLKPPNKAKMKAFAVCVLIDITLVVLAT